MTMLRASAVALALAALTASAAVAQSTKEYGKPLTLKVTTPISAILKNPKAFDGKRVQVEGTIVEVCEERGCWIRIASDKEFEAIRFKGEAGNHATWRMAHRGGDRHSRRVLVVLPALDSDHANCTPCVRSRALGRRHRLRLYPRRRRPATARRRGLAARRRRVVVEHRVRHRRSGALARRQCR